MTHGLTQFAYGCRCDICVEAQRTYYANWLKKVRQIAAQGHPEGKEPSVSIYKNWGCRCDECRAANTTYSREAARRRRAA